MILHCRIEGSASIACGSMIILSHIISIHSVIMMTIILGICIFTIVIEVLLKII